MKLAIVVLELAAGVAQAKVKSQLVEYKQGDTVLEGYLAYDDAISGKRPGILVVHAWMGLDDNARKRADMLAQAGYVAFAADIYGKGVQTQGSRRGRRASQASTRRTTARCCARRVAARARRSCSRAPTSTRTRPPRSATCFGGTTEEPSSSSRAAARRCRASSASTAASIVRQHAGRCQEHQEQGARAARRGRSVREARGLRRVPEVELLRTDEASTGSSSEYGGTRCTASPTRPPVAIRRRAARTTRARTSGRGRRCARSSTRCSRSSQNTLVELVFPDT